MEFDQGEMKVTVDAVVFTVKDDELKLLLIKRKYDPFKGMYALPGGFVQKDEELKDAVKRELQEETGVTNAYLYQYGAYGRVGRDPRGRVLSITYLALISPDQKLNPSTDAEEAEWFSVYDLPEVAFDHEEIITYALHELRMKIQTTNIAVEILPEKFTLSQLQSLYESVLNTELDKRNFRKKLKELDLVVATKEFFREGAHRPAQLYTFKEKSVAQVDHQVNIHVPEARKF